MDAYDLWPRAAFLDERGRHTTGDVGLGTDPDELDELVRAWCEDARMRPEHLDEKLRRSGMDRETFAATLAARRALAWTPDDAGGSSLELEELEDLEDVEALGSPSPAWCRVLKAVFAEWECQPDAGTGAPCCVTHAFFHRALGPLTRSAERLLAERLLEHDLPGPRLRIDRSAWDALRRNIADRLTALCGRVLVLEFNVARLEDRLPGEDQDPQRLMETYVEHLLAGKEEWWRLLQEYQAMARLIGTCIASWVDAVEELFGRLVADSDVLRGRWPAIREPLSIAGLRGGLSDPHRGGRTVWIIDLSATGGADEILRIVYKPRDVAIDVAFGNFVAWVDRAARSDGVELPELWVPCVIARDGFGWMEYVPRRDCQSVDEIGRFYVRQGIYLALFYLLDATDFHHENLIASGEHPVPVDLESLFHNRWVDRRGDESARMRAWKMLETSVLRTGLLPMWFSESNITKYNMSGMGDVDRVDAPYAVPHVEIDDKNGLHIAYHEVTMKLAENMPVLEGNTVGASKNTEHIVQGFRAAMHLFARHRDELLGPGRPIQAFAGLQTRNIARDTSLYAAILTDLTHPDTMRDSADREQFLDILWSAAGEHLLPLIPTEQRDLRVGDVPVFTSSPESLDLVDSRGGRVQGCFPSSAMSLATERIAAIDERMIEEQVGIMEAALSVSISGHGAHVSQPGSPAASRQPDPLGATTVLTEGLAVQLAAEMARRIEAAAIHGADDIAWFGSGYAGRDRWKLTAVQDSLYDGNAGIALFLAALGRLSGEARLLELAERVFRPVRSSMQAYRAGTEVGGGYMGLPSMLYGAVQLERLLDRPVLAAADLDGYLTVIERSVQADTQYDVIWGSAGAIGVLLTVHRLTGLERALAVAVDCGLHLARCATPAGNGMAWPTPGDRPLIPFAHGTSGMMWGLARLVDVIDGHAEYARHRGMFVEIIRGGLRYEQMHYNAEQRNWPDFRHLDVGVAPPDGRSYSCTWCNGSSGILLSRVAIAKVLGEEELHHQAEIAMETSLDLVEKWSKTNHDLCHGTLGVLSAVLDANRLMRRADWQARYVQVLNRVVREIAVNGPRCGSGEGLAIPALMNGLAGIGLGLLYQMFPDQVPDVIALH